MLKIVALSTFEAIVHDSYSTKVPCDSCYWSYSHLVSQLAQLHGSYICNGVTYVKPVSCFAVCPLLDMLDFLHTRRP